MAATQTGWRELLAGDNKLKVIVFAGGVAITAIEVYIGSTLMPSVINDIGGIELFAWVTTVFIVASIFASIFAAVRPFGLGPRHNYLIAAAAFGLGSLICGLAGNMPVLLVGRVVQGFGAGLLGALTIMMVRLVFPEHLWPRAFALASSMWGIATLVGPAIGGVFAEFGAWRWAFFVLVPASVLLGFGAIRVMPQKSSEAGMKTLPLAQIGLMIVAVMALSMAGASSGNVGLAAVLLAVALSSIVALALIEPRAKQRLLPTGTFVLGSTLALLFGVMVLLQMSIISDTFVPLFLQRLHGVGPLVAGYVVALLAVGWSVSAMIVAGWTGRRAQMLIAGGPIALLAGAVILALYVGRYNPAADLTVLLPIGLALLLMGAGIGSAWTHLTPRVMQAAPAGEYDVTSAALSTIQLFATGMGAALAGLIVNLTGIAEATTTTSAANWLYAVWMLLPALAVPLAFAIVRREASGPADAERVPAE